jgi:hypothetical protein
MSTARGGGFGLADDVRHGQSGADGVARGRPAADAPGRRREAPSAESWCSPPSLLVRFGVQLVIGGLASAVDLGLCLAPGLGHGRRVQPVRADLAELLQPLVQAGIGVAGRPRLARCGPVRNAHGPARPVHPDHTRDLSARPWIGDIHFIVLDCPDELRRARISARPAWRSRNIDEQVEFGRWLRRNIPDRAGASGGTPEETAAAIITWIDRHVVGPEGSLQRERLRP